MHEAFISRMKKERSHMQHASHAKFVLQPKYLAKILVTSADEGLRRRTQKDGESRNTVPLDLTSNNN
jgi:hypothetical protein